VPRADAAETACDGDDRHAASPPTAESLLHSPALPLLRHPSPNPICAHQLIRQHQHRLQAELPVAKVEQVLQAGPQQVDDHHVVVALDAVPPHIGDAHC